MRKKILIYLFDGVFLKYENYNIEFLLVFDFDMLSYGLYGIFNRNVIDCLLI